MHPSNLHEESSRNKLAHAIFAAGRKKYNLASQYLINHFSIKVEPSFLENQRTKILGDLISDPLGEVECDDCSIFVPNLAFSASDVTILLRTAVKYLGHLGSIANLLALLAKGELATKAKSLEAMFKESNGKFIYF